MPLLAAKQCLKCLKRGAQLSVMALQRPSSLHKADVLLTSESDSYRTYFFPMKATWPGAVAEGGRPLASSSPPLPSYYHCSSCCHQDLINQHRQGLCCLMPLAGRKLQNRMEIQSLVQKLQASVAAPALVQSVRVSLLVPSSTECMA